jgi:hypothetical protein
MLKERASAENVSLHGVRVLMKQKLRPGQHSSGYLSQGGRTVVSADRLLSAFGGA